MLPNHELFVQVLAELEAHPEAWNQDWWAERTPECGTTYCFAGHAVVLSGYEVDWHSSASDGGSQASCVVSRRSISEAAMELLGLSYKESVRLFGAVTDIDVIYSICADILGVDEQVLRDKVKAVRG